MKTLLLPLFFVPFLLVAQSQNWPVLTRYEGETAEKVAMPIGGIGTGTISIGGNGQWRDVEIMNKPALGYFGSGAAKQAPFFMLWVQDAAGKKDAKALMGPVPFSDYASAENNLVNLPNHGFPRFSKSSFDAAYPFATVHFEEEELPVSVRLKTFNPYIPGDADASGIPIAIIRYSVTNKTDKPLQVAVAGSLDNFIGMDGSKTEISDFSGYAYPIGVKNNRNTFRKTEQLQGIFMSSDSVPTGDIAWGTIALTTTDFKHGEQLSYRTELNPKGWNSNINDLWTDFAADGVFENLTFEQKKDSPRGALAVKTELKPNETREFQFFLTWHFPNRPDWNDREIIGNYYTTQYSDAWDVAEKVLPKLSNLESKTLAFVNTLLQSDYPEKVKEAALFNSSTLRTQTAFRDREGRFFGWEGVFPTKG